MSVHEPKDITVAYQDNSNCWQAFKQLVSSLFPLNEIRFQFEIGEYVMKNFKPAFYPLQDSFYQDIDSPIKAYKRPYVYLYLVTFSSIQDYNTNLKSQLAFLIEKHEKKPGEDKDEWLLIYTTPNKIANEHEYKAHFDNFQFLYNDFSVYNQNQDYARVISMFSFDDPKVEVNNITFDGLYKFSVSFISALRNSVQQRVAVLEDQMALMMESKDNASWDFLKFFALKENIAIIYEDLRMPLEAFQKYEELRNKYYEFVLRKPDKLRFVKEEFYLIKGKENPYLLDINMDKNRESIFENKITEFDFVQYLFARQSHFLKLMNWYHEGIERVKLFISDIFYRAVRELPSVEDQERFIIFQYIWSIQAYYGFLEFFNPKTFTNENPNAQRDLKIIRLNFRQHAIILLEQLYTKLYGSSIDKMKVKSFSEEFGTLLDIFEHGGTSSVSEGEKASFDLSLFDIKDQNLNEVIHKREAFLEYIFDEKVKFAQNAKTSECRKIGLFQAIESLKYRIEHQKLDQVKTEEIVSMIQTYDKIYFYDVSDILRIYLLRVHLQKRNFSELSVPFLQICKHQRSKIEQDFEQKNRHPFAILDSFCERNIGKSLRVPQAQNDFKQKLLAVDFDEDKNVLIVNYSLTNDLKFPISKCKMQLVIQPLDLKKKEDKSHKKLYEKYSWPVENLNPGENTNQVELKGKNSGTYKVKGIFLKISKFKFKIPVPNKKEAKEFTIQGDKRTSFSIQYKTLEGLFAENQLPSDNTLPLVLKFSQFSFRFDKVHLELWFTSHYTVFEAGNYFYSTNEKDELLQEETLEGSADQKANQTFDLKPVPEAKTLYLVLKIRNASQNREVYDTLNLKANCYLKSSHASSKEQSFAFHFSPLFNITPKFYQLPDQSFLHFDLVNLSQFPLKIKSLEAAAESDLIEPETQIESSEEFSVLVDNPKQKSSSTLNAKLSVGEQNEHILKKPFEGFPDFVQSKLQVGLDFCSEYEFKEYLDHAEPQYKLEIDFPPAVLYQQNYVLKVLVSLLPSAETKECSIAIEDKLNNWLCFGKTRFSLALELDKPQEISFNLLSISVGEIPLPKLSVYLKKVEKKIEKGKRPMLTINLQEVNQEDQALSEEKVDVRFSHSQLVQVFTSSTIKSENFSLI